LEDGNNVAAADKNALNNANSRDGHKSEADQNKKQIKVRKISQSK
jgi:hypothetical protein